MTGFTAADVEILGTTMWLSYLIRPGNAGQRQRVSLLRGSGATHSDANNMVKVKRIDGTWRMVVLNHAAELDTTADLLYPDWRKIGEITIGEDGHALFVHTDAGPMQFYRSIRRED